MQNNSLAVFSPTALTSEVRALVTSLGAQPRYLVCPDFEHHIFLSEWARAFPDARVLGPEGLPEKREAVADTKGIKFSHVYTAKNRREMSVDADFDKEFDVEYVASHGNKELVFCHRPSRTLIQADLVFNLPATEQFSRDKEDATSGLATKFFSTLTNTKGTAIWQQRFIWYAVAKDKKDFAASVQRIDGWDWDAMMLCHGDVIETGAKGVFRKVMGWYLEGQSKRV